jgi:hypothetical protein
MFRLGQPRLPKPRSFLVEPNVQANYSLTLSASLIVTHDCFVNFSPAGSKLALICGIAHECVLEAVRGIGQRTASKQKLGFDKSLIGSRRPIPECTHLDLSLDSP